MLVQFVTQGDSYNVKCSVRSSVSGTCYEVKKDVAVAVARGDVCGEG